MLDARDFAAIQAATGQADCIPGNPYPTPDARLEERAGYPFAVPSLQRPYAGPGAPRSAPRFACGHPDVCECGHCTPVP